MNNAYQEAVAQALHELSLAYTKIQSVRGFAPHNEKDIWDNELKELTFLVLRLCNEFKSVGSDRSV